MSYCSSTDFGVTTWLKMPPDNQQIIDTGKLVESDNPDYPICIDNQWYFEGVEVKKTAKKAQLSSMYGEMKEGK